MIQGDRYRWRRGWRAAGVFVVFLAACGGKPVDKGVFEVVMPTVQDGGVLDLSHVGGELGGKDNSPAFEFKSFPKGTRAWAFTVEVQKDDGKYFPYFATANHPPGSDGDVFTEGFFNLDSSDHMNPTENADGSTIFEGRGERIYHGPQPDSDDLDSVYTVRFSFYALSARLALEDGFRLEEFDRAARGKILGEKTYTTTFKVQ